MSAGRIGFLGPVGTFTHQAALTLNGSFGELVPFSSIRRVLDAVSDRSVDRGVVPIENAIEGTVSETIDGLLFDHQLLIELEIVTSIELHVMARSGVTLGEVTTLWSYSHALAQCRRFADSLSGIGVEYFPSTADAARSVSLSTEKVAAIAPAMAAVTYGLEILQANVQDASDNETRFVVVGRNRIPARSGTDRTTIVCFQSADRPGSLHGILGRFASRGINLTKIESRPTKKALGEYCFVMEFDGHLADPVVADCLADVQANLAQVKFLGSYPVTGDDAERERATTNVARDRADEWIEELRSLIER